MSGTIDEAERLRCAYCPRPALGFEPVSHVDLIGTWRREIVTTCSRCQSALRKAGRHGLVLKATDEKWWSGHDVGPMGNYKPVITDAVGPTPTKRRRPLTQSKARTRKGASARSAPP